MLQNALGCSSIPLIYSAAICGNLQHYGAICLQVNCSHSLIFTDFFGTQSPLYCNRILRDGLQLSILGRTLVAGSVLQNAR